MDYYRRLDVAKPVARKHLKEMDVEKLERWRKERPDLHDWFLAVLDYYGGEIEAVPPNVEVDAEPTVPLPNGTGISILNCGEEYTCNKHPYLVHHPDVRLKSRESEKANGLFARLNKSMDALYGDTPVVYVEDFDRGEVIEANRRKYIELFGDPATRGYTPPPESRFSYLSPITPRGKSVKR